MKNSQFVRWTTYALLALGVIYIGLIVWGIITQDPNTGFIRENVRILMEITTIISAVVLLFFALSIKNILGPKHNFLAEISVVFMTILVTLTSIVHFVSITISNQLVDANPLLSPLVSLNWPSLLLSIDILAWDVFFGVAFIFLGLSLRRIKGLSAVYILMVLSGILSLLGLIALPLNNMNLRFIGIFGYTVMPVISSAILLGKIEKMKSPS
jgi:hypothetical protein